MAAVVATTPPPTPGHPSPTGWPDGRVNVAVWSGSEMLVWGSRRENSNGNQNCSILVTQGARYNPANDAWTPMTLDNAPAGMRNPRAVWADDQHDYLEWYGGREWSITSRLPIAGK